MKRNVVVLVQYDFNNKMELEFDDYETARRFQNFLQNKIKKVQNNRVTLKTKDDLMQAIIWAYESQKGKNTTE